jgi:hypothetical protein
LEVKLVEIECFDGPLEVKVVDIDCLENPLVFLKWFCALENWGVS